ncbi:MAG: copper amine oxidase N-terminal domain-containing protein [Clostridia bacterium]|nr:copper amine oxidase N-terminal domain-containing protein [Clostridia bacterium]
MKKVFIALFAFLVLSTTVSADEFSSDADMSYSYDSKYDEREDTSDETASQYDSYGEGYDPSYDETINGSEYYGEKEEESVSKSDSYIQQNNENNTYSYYAESDDIIVFVDDVQIKFDVPPVIVNDRTMVPLRAIFEALGAEVDWIPEAQAVDAYLNNTRIVLYIGDNEMYRNGEIIVIDSPPFIKDDRTLVPVRAIAEAFDCIVEWDNDNRAVQIYSKTDSYNHTESGGYIDHVDLPEMYMPNGVLVHGNQLCFSRDDGLDMDGLYPVTIRVYTANDDDILTDSREFIIFGDNFDASGYCNELNDFSSGTNVFGMKQDWAEYYYCNNILIEKYTEKYLKEEEQVQTLQDVINMYEEYGWDVQYKKKSNTAFDELLPEDQSGFSAIAL